MSMWNNCPEPDLEPPEASLNYREEEDREEDEPDYEGMAERQREDLEWEADHAWYGNWNYPDDRW